jgi:hypothetical protein
MPQPYPQYQAPPPTAGTGRNLMATEFNVAILIVQILVILFVGYLFVIGLFSFIVNHDQGSAMMAGIAFAILLPIVLIMQNSGGIYENGIKVSRPLFMRLMGKRVFYRYEDIKAFFPAMFVTSAQMMTPRSNHSHPRYYPGPDVRAFGEAYVEIVTDPGNRMGVGIATDQGEFILKQATALSNQSPYGQMMYYIQPCLNVRRLPNVRKPLELSQLELESLSADAAPLGLRAYMIIAALAFGLPFIPLIIVYIYVMLTGDKSLLAVLLILLFITLSTVFFVAAYQYKETKRINATNRLNYYKASQPYLAQFRDGSNSEQSDGSYGLPPS